MSDAPACLNCDTPVVGPYCPACGQHHADALRLTAGVTFVDVVDQIVQVNGRLAVAAADLVLRPGRLTADFLAGRRARHPPPAKLYLVVNFVFFLAVQWVDPVTATTIVELVGGGLYDRFQAGSGLSTTAFAGAVEATMGTALATALIVFVPAVAVVLRVLYAGRPVTLVAHTVFGFHLTAFWLLAMLPGLFLDGAAGVTYVNVGMCTAFPVWAGLALHRVYGGAWGRTLVRTAALWLCFVALLVLYILTLSLYALMRAG